MTEGWAIRHYWKKDGDDYRSACGLVERELTLEKDTDYSIKCSECRAMRSFQWTAGNELIQEAMYYNANGFAIAVVAVISPFIDWTAYIGGCDLTKREEDAVRWTAQYGVKLPWHHAHHFFSNLPRRMYRA